MAVKAWEWGYLQYMYEASVIQIFSYPNPQNIMTFMDILLCIKWKVSCLYTNNIVYL